METEDSGLIGGRRTIAAIGGQCRVVAAEGELDLLTAPGFGRRLREAGEGPLCPRPYLIVDLCRVSFMDAVPSRELCAARHRSRVRGGWARIVYTHRCIAVVVRAAGLAEVFPRYASVDDALHDRVSEAPG